MANYLEEAIAALLTMSKQASSVLVAPQLAPPSTLPELPRPSPLDELANLLFFMALILSTFGAVLMTCIQQSWERYVNNVLRLWEATRDKTGDVPESY